MPWLKKDCFTCRAWDIYALFSTLSALYTLSALFLYSLLYSLLSYSVLFEFYSIYTLVVLYEETHVNECVIM